MSTIKTVEGQNIWDIVIRYSGDINQLKSYVSQLSDLNSDIPSQTELEQGTTNNIVTYYDNNQLNIVSTDPLILIVPETAILWENGDAIQWENGDYIEFEN